MSYYPTGQELKSTNRPIYGAASVSINKTIYMYGGFYNVPPWNKEAMWTLSDQLSLTQLKTDPFASPALIYTSLQYTANNSLLAFGGHLSEQDITITNNQEPEYLRYYAFNLESLKWTPLQKKRDNNTHSAAIDGSPLDRFWHTTVMDNAFIYLYGGMNTTGGINDFWKYDIFLDQWRAIDLNVKSRCGHTSTMISEGRIVNLGGFDCSQTSFIRPHQKSLYALESASIFDTGTGSWYEQNLGGPQIPKSRIFHTAVKTKNDRIVICGGQDHTVEPFQNYLGADVPDDMTAILDTFTWQWYIPESSPYQPFPRSHAIANMINETTMLYGFGVNYHTVFDGVYAFDLNSRTWQLPSTERADNHIKGGATSNSILLTVCLSILLGGVVIILLVFIFCFGVQNSLKIRQIFTTIKKSIWCPRSGEPLWVELYRLSFRFLFALVFIGVGTILFLQVYNSPIMDQQYYHHESDYSIAPPDIRFCFDDWEVSPAPFIQCVTDYGEPCSQYITNITSQVGSNVNYYGGKLNCHLFRVPTGSIKLGKTSNRYRFDGSYLRFHYYGKPHNQSQLHVELYHPQHDPNIPVYNLSSEGFDRWYSPDENAKFQSMEQMNLKTENAFAILPSSMYNSIGYEYLERKRIMLNNVWNYIGLGSERIESQYFISSQTMSKKAEQQFVHSTKQPAGIVHILPMTYSTSISGEQRMFTLMNCLGIIGGIFGLITGCHASLFGYRPRSPWGVLHRWSIRLMQKSLLNGLKSKLPLDEVNIPIVHPVNKRMVGDSTLKEEVAYAKIPEESESRRMKKLEDRLHIFELLFQAYYIDDEVFRSLQTKDKQ